MALYELRTYTLYVGKIKEAVEIYTTLGWPAIQKYEDKLVGYFLGDIGALNEVVHLWKFDDDMDRRRTWETIYKDEDFLKFAAKFRPLILKQENKLLVASPWGPHP